jgi:hypothetical protein
MPGPTTWAYRPPPLMGSYVAEQEGVLFGTLPYEWIAMSDAKYL